MIESNSVLWLNAQGIVNISPLGAVVADLLGSAWAGIYHIDRRRLMKTDWSNDTAIKINISDGGISTYDSNLLTTLVFLSHSQNVRMEINAATHGFLEFVFLKVSRSGFFADRHPTLYEAVETFRSQYPAALIGDEDQYLTRFLAGE